MRSWYRTRVCNAGVNSLICLNARDDRQFRWLAPCMSTRRHQPPPAADGAGYLGYSDCLELLAAISAELCAGNRRGVALRTFGDLCDMGPAARTELGTCLNLCVTVRAFHGCRLGRLHLIAAIGTELDAGRVTGPAFGAGHQLGRGRRR